MNSDVLVIACRRSLSVIIPKSIRSCHADEMDEPEADQSENNER